MNKEKVSGEKILKDGDVITFGSDKSLYTYVWFILQKLQQQISIKYRIFFILSIGTPYLLTILVLKFEIVYSTLLPLGVSKILLYV